MMKKTGLKFNEWGFAHTTAGGVDRRHNLMDRILFICVVHNVQVNKRLKYLTDKQKIVRFVGAWGGGWESKPKFIIHLRISNANHEILWLHQHTHTMQSIKNIFAK